MSWDPAGLRLPADEVLVRPGLARYVAGFPRSGDTGVVLEQEGELMGAAWVRLFAADSPGYGWVDADTPELSVGVVEQARGRGLGTLAVHAAMRAAWRGGFDEVSLSVAAANPARRLYERCGFRVVGVGSDHVTMRATLTDGE